MRIVLAVLLLGLLFASVHNAAADTNAAPDFTLKNLDGALVKLSDVYKQGPVILSFWSTWCKNCPEEMKHFQRFYDQYKEQGLTVLGISIDGTKTVAKVKPWVTGRRLNFPILLDQKGDVMRLYHVKPVPHSFIVDREGQIVYSHVGYRPGDEVKYEKEIQKLLAKTSVTEEETASEE